MKKLLFLALIVGTTLSSCSKKSNPTPKATNTVTINGTSYGTVSIGTQIWTTVNYNGAGGTNYNGSSTNNPNYGKLYTWQEAQTITPTTGWRIPTQADAIKLLLYLGAAPDTLQSYGAYGDATISIKLKSKTGWIDNEGNNSSGFNAYPVGEQNGNYIGFGSVTEFWTSTPNGTNDQYTLHIPDGTNVGDNAVFIDYCPIGIYGIYRMSIRFVKDN